VPKNIIEETTDEETRRRYHQFELKDFVDSNPNTKYCPHPGCEMVLQRTDQDENSGNTVGNRAQGKGPGEYVGNNTADCGSGHYFCFQCNGEPHDPCSCAVWERWESEQEKHKESTKDSIRVLKDQVTPPPPLPPLFAYYLNAA